MHKSKNFIRKTIIFLQFTITRAIDFFYPPFRKMLPLTTFRYGVTGAANMCLDLVLYFICYNTIFHIFDKKEVVYFKFVPLTPHIASLLIVFPITFFTGFLLSKYINFSDSIIKSRIQLFRYLLVVAGCLLINYVLLKIFVEICGFYPTPSKMLIVPVAVTFSYLTQRYYTFKK